jgi:putative hydrolase of the HAD superfamily
MPPAAVVFDLDYTLAVTNRDRQVLLDEATTSAGTHAIDRDEYLGTHDDTDASETRAPIFERLLEEGDAADAESLATAYRTAIQDALEPLPGAAGLLENLRRNYRLGLLTDGPERAQWSKIDHLGWDALFDAIVVTGTLPAGKPDPNTFRTICADLDVAPADAVYIGDRPETDIAGATAVGMAGIQVLYPDGPDPNPDAVATVERDHLVERLPDILENL